VTTRALPVLFRATRIAKMENRNDIFLQIADAAANINKKISSGWEYATSSRISVSLALIYTRRYLLVIGSIVVF
jgi:hypothetical protein